MFTVSLGRTVSRCVGGGELDFTQRGRICEIRQQLRPVAKKFIIIKCKSESESKGEWRQSGGKASQLKVQVGFRLHFHLHVLQMNGQAREPTSGHAAIPLVRLAQAAKVKVIARAEIKVKVKPLVKAKAQGRANVMKPVKLEAESFAIQARFAVHCGQLVAPSV